MLQSIPATLAPFFQEYDLETLDPQTAAPLIIERTLEFGNRAEIHWLFTEYTRAQVTDWFNQFARDRLPNPHRTFWQIVLEIKG